VEIREVCGYIGHIFIMVFRTLGTDAQNLFPYYYLIITVLILLRF